MCLSAVLPKCDESYQELLPSMLTSVILRLLAVTLEPFSLFLEPLSQLLSSLLASFLWSRPSLCWILRQQLNAFPLALKFLSHGQVLAAQRYARLPLSHFWRYLGILKALPIDSRIVLSQSRAVPSSQTQEAWSFLATLTTSHWLIQSHFWLLKLLHLLFA